ncbi:MAG: type II toxin-antitoxin system prevent-host-death family antitoxin [Rhizobium sp.]|nr:type II toxin-antitoxin system prevent-host-death family antitoxin [Rhizobium sp.]
MSIEDASKCLPELVQRALDGERVILTEHGRDVAELIPVHGAESGAEREPRTG